MLKNVGEISFCKQNKEGEGKLKISPRLNGNDRNQPFRSSKNTVSYSFRKEFP